MLSSLAIALAVLSAGLQPADDPHAVHWDFEDATLGKLPPDWSSTKTGEGPGSVWKVIEQESAPSGRQVLAQTSSQGPRPLFNLCVADKPVFGQVDLTVSFKAVSGKIDQGGGPVWRYRDADNYYIARMNPLENNFRVYKVVAGKRTQLGTAEVEAPAGEWHSIRIVQKGDHIRCHFNGKLHLDVMDDTFPEAGRVGLWTKADAVTHFDDLKVTAPGKSDGSIPHKKGELP